MDYIFSIIMGVFFVCSPYIMATIRQKTGIKKYFSKLVLCFLLGILLGNLPDIFWPTSMRNIAYQVANTCTIFSVLMAIPILLMSSPLAPSLRLAPRLLGSFLLCIVSISLVSCLFISFYPSLKHIQQVIPCLTAVYIGGTPNMISIAYATQIPESLFLSLNTTDIIWSSFYFVFLITIGPKILGYFLKQTPAETSQTLAPSQKTILPINETISLKKTLNKKFMYPRVVATCLALILIAVAYAWASLFPTHQGAINQMLLMLVLTSLSITLSFHPKIKTLEGNYDYAQYLLLIFAVGIGFQSNFHQLLQEGSRYFIFNGLFLVAFISTHLILSIIFRIDRDTFILSSTACVFGPPFVGQICDHIKQPQWIAAGIALGILGLVCGTYLGIIMAELLSNSAQ